MTLSHDKIKTPLLLIHGVADNNSSQIGELEYENFNAVEKLHRIHIAMFDASR